MSADTPLLFKHRPTLEEAAALARDARYSALASVEAHKAAGEPPAAVAAWERRAAIWELIENEMLGIIGDRKRCQSRQERPL